MKTTSRILPSFCYDYFEDILAPITFAKNFGSLANVVSKIFAIKNVVQIKKINFCVMHLEKVIYHDILPQQKRTKI